MVFFIQGKMRVDLVALCVLAALVLLGLINTRDALYGFSSPATATVTAWAKMSHNRCIMLSDPNGRV